MPSYPGRPPEQPTTERPSAVRNFESFEWYEAGSLVLAANALFQEIITFSGRPDSIEISTIGGPLNFRLRNRGQAAGTPINIPNAGTHNFRLAAEIVEVQDPLGAGAQRASVIGRFASRHIDVRNNRPGPRRRGALDPAEERGAPHNPGSTY